MRILQLNIRNFRGFSEFELKPNDHVLIMGEPGTGKSDIINALVRLLHPYSDRLPTSELDYCRRNISDPIEIEATIGELDGDLQQEFFDEIEFWNLESSTLVAATETISEIDEPHCTDVVRFGYRVDWTDEDDQQRVQRYFPKEGRAGITPFRRVTRTKIQRLGFAYALGMQANPLSLAPRSIFRRIIDASDEMDFESSIHQYLRAVADAASSFAATNQVNLALEEILTNVRPLFDGVQPHEQVNSVRFAPSELSNSSLMRALEPSFNLGDELGYVPRSRLGTTVTQSLGVSEALASTVDRNGIVAIDDLGDGLDAATAQHLAATAINRTGQCWITTRSGAVAEAFEPSEVVRLSRHSDGRRRRHQGWTHDTKQDRKLVRNWYRLLAPALNYRAVAVVEGPSDFAALHALCLILSRKSPGLTPARHGLSIVSAAEQGSGGDKQVLELAQYSAEMGINAVAVVDGDKGNADYSNLTCEQYGTSIVRLPDRVEIEKAIICGVQAATISDAVSQVCEFSGLFDNRIRTCGELEVSRIATRLIKDYNLHRHIVEALAEHAESTLLFKLLQSIIQLSKLDSPEFIQL